MLQMEKLRQQVVNWYMRGQIELPRLEAVSPNAPTPFLGLQTLQWGEYGHKVREATM